MAKITTVPQYLKAVAKYSRGTLFRGVPDKSYELLPGIGRVKELAGDKKTKQRTALRRERKLLRNFNRSAALYIPQQMDFTSMAILAQHHGVPTRFLDWSYNRLVALYFAVRNLDESVDAKIYITKIKRNTSQSVIQYDKYVMYEDRDLTDEFRDVEGDDIKGKFYEYQKFIMKKEGIRKSIFSFLPTYINSRMSSQASVFTFHPDPFTPMTEADGLVGELLIPRDSKRDIKRGLEHCGVHEFSIFPGLDGLGEWVKNVFWPETCGDSGVDD